MKVNKLALVALATGLLTGGSTLAQDADAESAVREPPTLEERKARREAMRERYQNMSDEEREAFRKEMREKHGDRAADKRKRRADLTEDERAAMRERWQNMSEEERQAAREKMRERRAQQRQNRTPEA